MKLYYLIVIFFVLSATASFSQQFVQEWEISGDLTYVGDIDGDGVGEFVNYDGDNFITTFYDGQNHNLKWTITDKEFEDNIFDADANVHPTYLKFPSVDFNGDGKRDVFFNTTDGKGILIIDVINNTTIFEWTDASINRAEFYVLSDVDGDGSLELVFHTQAGGVPPDPYINKTYVYSTGLTASALEDKNSSSPKEYRLEQNYPNPFNPSTTIRYSISSPEKISVKIYNISGQLIKEIVNEHSQAGEYDVIWDGKNNFGQKVSSGTYFYQLTSRNYIDAKKMILLK
jgi:FlgD Ig-like domain